MPRNLKNKIRSELIRQRRNSKRIGGRDKAKKMKEGKYTDYGHIYSDRSYKAHLERATKFAEYCQENGIKDFDQITPSVAQKYLIYERDKGYSASTIGASALAINHVMIGGGFWHESQKIMKSKIAGMPKRSTKIVNQREKSLTSKEWRDRYPNSYQKYQNQIDTVRALGLRRRELTGGSSYNGKDGLGTKSLYWSEKGRVLAVTIGKGGKFRTIECRLDLQPKIVKLYGKYIQPADKIPQNKTDFLKNMRSNKPFYHSFSHAIPTHIFRSDYAQNKLRELASKPFSGEREYSYSKRMKTAHKGKYYYSRVIRKHDLSKPYQIGSYRASYGAFYALSKNMGHNRLDVLQSYLGEGR